MKYAVGVDLGGTSIKIGLVNSEGKIFKKISLPTNAEKGPKAVIKEIKKGVQTILKGNRKKIEGIGIGAPGTISLKKGTVEYPPNFPGWGRIHLGKILQNQLDKKVFVENDANTAAIGELIFGHGKKFDTFIMITLGTGVGGGIIFNRKLFRGEGGGAGEIGHISIDYQGKQCNCGSKGCIEAYLGNNYIIEDVKKELKKKTDSVIWKLIDNDFSNLTPKTIHEAALLNDEFAINKIKELGFYLGCGLVSAINILDIPTIIIGGGVAGFGKLLFDSVENTVLERVLTPLKSKITVKHSKLKNEAGIKGAAALVYYKY